MTTAPANVPTRLGPYEVGAKIGGGGMATVYVGRRVEGKPENEVVALKLVRDELAGDRQYIAMFLDEAKILSRLSHEDIIVTRDFGVEGETRFIAMELLLGRSLLDTFERANEVGSRMPIDLAAFVAQRVALALDYAHALENDAGAPLRLIHRDVNPTNIFLTYAGAVKLIDFGLAKSVGRLAKSGEGIVKGKVPYLSPEQVEDKPFDHRADLYALGATLWEMTTGRRLFKRATDVDTIRAIRAHEVPDPRTFVEGLYPDALWKIIQRALEVDPAARYASGAEMARDLEAFATKHGRKGDMEDVLAAWIEELFPGERTKQEAWLEDVSAASASAKAHKETMAPPAPIAEVPESTTKKPVVEEVEQEAVATPVETKKHPFAALLALAATLGFLGLLTLICSRC